jgi:hypothetical protein
MDLIINDFVGDESEFGERTEKLLKLRRNLCIIGLVASRSVSVM